ITITINFTQLANQTAYHTLFSINYAQSKILSTSSPEQDVLRDLPSGATVLFITIKANLLLFEQ
ncbi:hypothetical protein, partial [Vibrio crassostreae]|uniref:hypothetical protein n=1 Tax=Vibrio crassostreae TaxID=246167 RepID=UPI001B30A56E